MRAKAAFPFMLLSFTAYGGTCPLTETGTSLFGPGGKGYIDWHGFIPGTATSTHRQNITSAAVDPRSNTWLTTNTHSTQGVVLNNPMFQSDAFGSPWIGQVIHYVHGNTQRRMSIISKSKRLDPGTMPVPNRPRIAGYYGPFSRPQPGGQFGPYLIDPGFYLIRLQGPGDQQMHVVDIDNCIEYDAYGCDDLGSGISCSNYGAYDLLAGDVQRPYAVSDVSNTASVSGIPGLYGRLGWDEWNSPGGIKHAINVTAMNGWNFLVPAFTGAANHAQYPSGNAWDNTRMPFGSKIRLKASFDPKANGIPAGCMPLINVLKTYGAIFVDGGLTANAAIQEVGNLWPWDCPVPTGGSVLFTPANAEVVVQSQSHIYCIPGYTGCPDSLPTGSAPTISSFTINGGASAAVALTENKQTVSLVWSVSGVVDLDGNPVRLRYISWGPNNSFGPGPIDGPGHGESMNVTVCFSNGCDIQNSGTYSIELMVQNRFGRTSRNITLKVK
jgi:hypothetical protein